MILSICFLKLAVCSSFGVENLCPKQIGYWKQCKNYGGGGAGGGGGGAADLLFLLLVLIFILTHVRGFRNRSFMMGNTVQCVMTLGTFRMLTLCVGC